MTEWFDNQYDTHKHDTTCSCSKRSGIFLDKRQLNRLVALSLVVGVFIFSGGYFWGQRVATDQLLNVVERDSFADQIYYSMCSMYDLKDDESNEPDVVSGEEETERVSEQQTANNASGAATNVNVAEAPATYAPAETDKRYSAQLVGFGSQKAAEQFVAKLEKKNIKVNINKRYSKTPRGKVIYWYQAVTPPFATKDELNLAIADIKKVEKLHDVRIVETGLT